MIDKIKLVSFANIGLKEAFLELKKGKFEEKNLYEFINRAIDDLKINPFSGIRVPKSLWPKRYIKDYNITNLWKYDLPNAWRLTYTLIGDEVKIISMILEWYDHKGYERRFSY